MEEAFERFELTSSEGSQHAVDVHLSVMMQALPVLDNHSPYADEIRRLMALADPTKHQAQGLATRQQKTAADSLHPLSLAYVILGSRLGSRVIARRIEKSEGTIAPDVHTFLSDANSGDAWRLLCRDLDAVTSTAERRRILADANAAFAIYHETALASLPEETGPTQTEDAA